MIMEKACSKCGEVKALTEFYKNNTCKGRRVRVCKTCYSIKVGKVERSKAAIELIKAIMSKPINPRATHHYYMPKNPIQREQEIGL